MSSDPQSILDAAMQLPEEARLQLVSRLLESLPLESLPRGAETLSIDDADLADEFDRRFADKEWAIRWSDLKAGGNRRMKIKHIG